MARMSLKENITEFVAGLLLIGSFVILIMLFFVEVPTANKDMLNILSGSWFGGTAMVVSFYYGQSKKRDTIPEPNTSISTTTKTEEIK